MKKITRWSPDTCGCKIDIEWDTDDPKINTHTIVEACHCHSGKVGSDILSENQIKNKAMQIAAENSAELATLTDDGKTLPNLEKLSFSYDQDRKLILTSKVSCDKSKIQTELDTKIGIGKVSFAI